MHPWVTRHPANPPTPPLRPEGDQPSRSRDLVCRVHQSIYHKIYRLANVGSAAPASLYPKTFEFISTDPLAKQQPDTRAFIRSYVMRGKNTKKRNKLPESGPDATCQAGEGAPQEEPEVSQRDKQLSRTTKDPNKPDPKVTNQGYALAFDKHGSTTVVVMSVFFPAPIKAPHDLSLWNFSDLLDYSAMLRLNSCACHLSIRSRLPQVPLLICKQSSASSRRPCTL